MKESLISFKTHSADVDVSETSRVVAGYFGAFGNKDSDDDIIVKGAFAKSISERGPSTDVANKIAFLWQHDMKEPLGKLDVLKEDDHGLYFEAKISDFELGDRVLAQYKDGTLNQHSIGFRYVADKIKFDEEQDAYIVKEVNLFEGSVVTLGANTNTPFVGMKSNDPKTLIKEINTFFKKLDVSKEEIFTLRKYFEQYKHLEPSVKDILSRKEEQADQQSNGVLDYEYLLKNLKE